VIAALSLGQKPAGKALVFRDGELLENIDLTGVTAPYSFTVENGSGVNVISVERGRICISQANCPDGYCVRQGWASGSVMPVVCLPNRLVIKLEGMQTPGVDAIVG